MSVKAYVKKKRQKENKYRSQKTNKKVGTKNL